MTKTYWELLTARRKLHPLLRETLEENRGLFDTRRRAPPKARVRPWQKTRSSLNKLQKMATELHHQLAFVELDVYKTLFSDKANKREIGEIRQQFQCATDALNLLKQMLEAGQKNHKKANEFTRKKLDREYLKIIFDYTNRAHRKYTGERIQPEKRLAPLWLVEYINSIDSEFGRKANLIEQAFQEWLGETAPANVEVPDVDAVYRLGSRYIVVRGLFDDDAVEAHIQSDLRGFGDFYGEIPFEDLALLERLPVSPMRDFQLPDAPKTVS